MSSVITPWSSRTLISASPKSSPTGPTIRTSVKKLAARAKWTAEPPSIRSRSPKGVRTESKAIDPTAVSDISWWREGYSDRGVRRPGGAQGRRGSRPRTGRRPGRGERGPRRDELRGYARDPKRLPRRADPAADPRRGDQRHDARRAPRGGDGWQRGIRAEGRRARGVAGPTSGRGQRRPGRRTAAAGPDGACAAPLLRPHRGGRDGRDRGRGGWYRDARRPARQASRRPGDRAGLQRGETGARRAARSGRNGGLSR